MENKLSFVGLPFYTFITLILGIVAAIGVAALWAAEAWTRLAVFVAALSLHLAMYWVYVRYYNHPRIHFIFYSLQTLVILGVFFILRGLPAAATILGTMILTMIGESIGLWGNTRRALYLSLAYGAFGVILVYFLVPHNEFTSALLTLGINGGFVITLLVMFNQQLVQKQQALELAETLESANALLTASTAKIERLTLQTERQRMARELHDTLAQGVAGLSLQLEAVKMHLKAGRAERALAITEQAIARAHTTLAESRAAIDDLRAGPEDLVESIQEKVERFTQATGIPCPLELNLGGASLSAERIEHVLRILSESLANIAHHAQASQAGVRFDLAHSGLLLEVRDDGKGFAVDESAVAGHYGLVGMRERARLTGGVLEIESQPGHGTLVRLRILQGPTGEFA
ncbi:MAG: sensor histidine kinase [Chloroflexota bacterium]